MQRCDLGSAAGLAEDRHAMRIAAKLGRVIANPRERLHKIKEADVPRRGVRCTAQSRQIQMTEDVQAMIDGHDDDVAAATQPFAVVERARPGTAAEFAAVDIEEYWTLAAVSQTRRPDIQIQAILTGRFARVRIADMMGRIQARCALLSMTRALAPT